MTFTHSETWVTQGALTFKFSFGGVGGWGIFKYVVLCAPGEQRKNCPGFHTGFIDFKRSLYFITANILKRKMSTP